MILQVSFPDKVIYIPVEIKCLDSSLKSNKDSRRYISIASKQNLKVARILSELNMDTGLLLILSDNFSLSATLISL